MRDDRALGCYVLDAQGDPLLMPDVWVWATWLETADRRVALTRVGEGCVSTVFLGIAHTGGDGDPLLWETLTFDVPGLDQDCQRYASRADAVHGHAGAVLRAQAALHIAKSARHA